MVKKRPRSGARLRAPDSGQLLPRETLEYWRERLFRNTFTYKGRRFEVNHWSVKIQHRGRRKTFSLPAGDPAQAAIEARELYKRIVNRGWDSLSTDAASMEPLAAAAPNPEHKPLVDNFDANYWADRLVYRKYAEELHANARPELSVRMHHVGISHYFPLQTDDRTLAASRAASIYKKLIGQGWEAVNEAFPRELSVAFRWLDRPVAWTYTTIHTRTGSNPRWLIADRRFDSRLNIAIAEPDAGIRQALAWCINQQEGFYCDASFATAASALREIPRTPFCLALVSQDLVDQPGPDFLQQLALVAPKVATLLYSVFEDADQLFEYAPGGAGLYVLRRTAPTRILEPIVQACHTRTFSRNNLAHAVRSYFQGAVAALPVGATAHDLSSLTRREHEILELLRKGYPDKEIANALGISSWTVHGHVKNIFAKLDVHTRTEAVVRSLQK